jgi:hypothetical protein
MSGVTNGKFDDKDYIAFLFQQHSFKMNKDGQILSSWILLDNQSTVDVLHNEDLLDNIHNGDGFMAIHCKARITSTNLVGHLPGYVEVWYNPSGIANTRTLSRVKER